MNPRIYGAAGEFVKLIEPHTEADPGCAASPISRGIRKPLRSVGRYRFAGGVAHHLNEYAINSGDTSRARKGTSWAEVERFMEKLIATGRGTTSRPGCQPGKGSSGTCAIQGRADGRGNGSKRLITMAGMGAPPDAGVTDKRLMVQAGGIRGGAESGDARRAPRSRRYCAKRGTHKTLRTLAKNNPATATGAHVSITAHITHEELARALDSTEIANGFANRFVWVCARRSKLLPWGGTVQDIRVSGLATRSEACGRGSAQAQRIHLRRQRQAPMGASVLRF